jgi:TolB-like protein/Tfp pilus assembly protein PilF
MDPRGSTDTFLFEGFRFDRSSGELFRLDEAANGSRVTIGSRALDLLGLLVERPGKLVSKAEIIDVVWRGMAVEEANLTVQISVLRRILDQNREHGSCIQTVPGRGYRFIIPVTYTETEGGSGASADDRSQAGGVGDSRESEPTTPISFVGQIAEQRNKSTDVHSWRKSDLSLPDLPSIAVLPFRNLRPDSLGNYFSRGIVEDIVVSLSGLHELFVISSGSTAAYRNEDPDPRDVGRELGVRYIVRGSVTRSGRRLRVSCELCEAESGRNIWADRVQLTLGDIFDLQDNLVERFAANIAPHVRAAEVKRALRKRPETLTAYDYTLQALELLYPIEQKNFQQAGALLTKAIEKEPTFAMPHAWLARWHNHRVGLGWSSSPAAGSAEALRLAEKAIELDRRNGLALAICGHIKSFLFHDYDSALYHFDTALNVSPNGSLAWALSSPTLSYVGRGIDAVRRAEHALRLFPIDQGLFYYHSTLSLAHYTAGKYEEAVKWGRLAMAENPDWTSNLRWLAAALAAAGRRGEAREVAQALKARDPTLTLSKYGVTQNPFRDKPQRDLHLEHLRRAGLRD